MTELAPIEIRRVRAGEADRWRTLRLAALTDAPSAFWWSYAEEAAHPVEEWQRRVGDAATATDAIGLVAQRGEDWVGMVIGEPEEEPGVALLGAMWVHPEARGGGLGRRLVDAIVRWAGTTGFTRIRLWANTTNQAALALYRSCGFEPDGVTRPLHSDPAQTVARLTRSLGA